MTKQLYLPLVFLTALLFTSCYPYMMVPPPQAPVETPKVVKPKPKPVSKPKVSYPNQTVTSPTQKTIRQQEDLKPKYEQTTPTVSAPKPPVKKSYPTAAPIPGKPGYVFNPYNNNQVNVSGIPAGKTVRDPQDPNTAHKFKVP